MLGTLSGMSAAEPIGSKATQLLLPLAYKILPETLGLSREILVQLEAPVQAQLLLSRLQNKPVTLLNPHLPKIPSSQRNTNIDLFLYIIFCYASIRCFFIY